MRIINRARCTGKSSMMVSTSYVTGVPIVVDTISRKDNLQELAHKMGCGGISVYTVEEIKKLRGIRYPEKVMIDEAESIIHDALNAYLNTDVTAISLSSRMRDLPNEKIQTSSSQK